PEQPAPATEADGDRPMPDPDIADADDSEPDPVAETEDEPVPAPEEEDDGVSPKHATTGDDFDRADAPGWGEDATGADWRIDGLDPESLSIEDGSGRIDLTPGSSGQVLLDSASDEGSELEAQFVLHGEGAAIEGTEIGIAARASEQGGYRVAAEVGPE